jgi:hypothetical protein
MNLIKLSAHGGRSIWLEDNLFVSALNLSILKEELRREMFETLAGVLAFKERFILPESFAAYAKKMKKFNSKIINTAKKRLFFMLNIRLSEFKIIFNYNFIKPTGKIGAAKHMSNQL